MNIFVALVSRHWIASKDWCQKEWGIADGRSPEVAVVPIYLSPCQFARHRISKCQGYKASDGKAITEHPKKEWKTLVNEAVQVSMRPAVVRVVLRLSSDGRREA